MRIKKTSEQEFFQGLNQRIAELAEKIEETAEKIKNNPDSSTYHLDNFFHPMKIMRKLQKIRDKAKAFKENEEEEVVYVKKVSEKEKPRYYYLPKSQFDRSQLSDIIRQMEKKEDTEPNLGYIS
ncbi:MAG: hypothetical protein SVV03_01535 [Candidatus Nanohaloarchaea archaeon]|nr:hypothetical protein [Candidatus Nanohaloarchaea archaeon]